MTLITSSVFNDFDRRERQQIKRLSYVSDRTDRIVSGAIRGGLNTARKDNPGLNLVTVGAGVNFYRAGFDFAWVPFGDLGNTFRFSLLLAF